MKVTGPTKDSTKVLIVELEKHAKKTNTKLFKVLAETLSKPRRKRIEINLWKLNKLSKQFAGKTLVVPGKVLSYGNLELPISVVAFSYSQKAKNSITQAKGQALTLKELMNKNLEANTLLLVK